MSTKLKERPVQDQAADSDKDSTEEELERILFGDSVGFRTGLRAFREGGVSREKELVLAEQEAEEESDAESIPGVAAQGAFFFDTAPAEAGAPAAGLSGSESEKEEGAAWSDSDDDLISISLAGRNQLRKLRRTEAEDVVTGREYTRRLRRQFELLHPLPQWVVSARDSGPVRKRRRSRGGSGESSSSEDEDEEAGLEAEPLSRLLRDSDALTRMDKRSTGKKRKFRPEVIDIQRMKDIATSGPSAITSLQIHPQLPLLLTSGMSKTLSLYHLTPTPPTPNPLLTSLHLKNTPLYTSAFHPSSRDSRIFLAGRRRYMHVWNLGTGHVEKVTRVYGQADTQRSFETFRISPDGAHVALLGTSRTGGGGLLNILNATTLQWVAQARVDSYGGVADFAWWRSGGGLSIAGRGGEVTEWSLEERRAVARWRDEGAVGTTTIALGGEGGRQELGGDRWVAVGSTPGIVNVYDRGSWGGGAAGGSGETVNGLAIPTNPKPLRVLDQLVTVISHLTFSPCGQVLCMASRLKADALRLVHLPSCAVYRNWPTAKTPFGRVSAVAFGENAEGTLCLIVGNERGAVRGWEVRS